MVKFCLLKAGSKPQITFYQTLSVESCTNLQIKRHLLYLELRLLNCKSIENISTQNNDRQALCLATFSRVSASSRNVHFIGYSIDKNDCYVKPKPFHVHSIAHSRKRQKLV